MVLLNDSKIRDHSTIFDSQFWEIVDVFYDVSRHWIMGLLCFPKYNDCLESEDITCVQKIHNPVSSTKAIRGVSCETLTESLID